MFPVIVGTGTLRDDQGTVMSVALTVVDQALLIVANGAMAASWPLRDLRKIGQRAGLEIWTNPKDTATLELAGDIEAKQLQAAMRQAGIEVV